MNTYIPTVDVAVDFVDDVTVRLEDKLLLPSRKTKQENKYY